MLKLKPIKVTWKSYTDLEKVLCNLLTSLNWYVDISLKTLFLLLLFFWLTFIDNQKFKTKNPLKGFHILNSLFIILSKWGKQIDAITDSRLPKIKKQKPSHKPPKFMPLDCSNTDTSSTKNIFRWQESNVIIVTLAH